jgi:serine O-acetyltransferase
MHLMRTFRVIVRILMTPLLIPFFLTKEKEIIIWDVRRWTTLLDRTHSSDIVALLSLLADFGEFRTLYYYRICRGNLAAKVLVIVIRVFYKGCPSLIINCASIGPGLFIQHGFSTIIAAESIGANCWINQQVTIGYRNKQDQPTIGNNVTIYAGAKVIGAVIIGDHVTVGANAVVVKSVPENCVVAGVPAYIVRRDGVRVQEPLP